MLSRDELFHTLALQRVPNLGDASAKKLLQVVGSAEGVFKEKKTTLLKVDGIGRQKLKDLNTSNAFVDAEREMEYIDSNQISCSFFKDDNYPERLKHCLDGPLLLFCRGDINLMSKRIISVVK